MSYHTGLKKGCEYYLLSEFSAVEVSVEILALSVGVPVQRLLIPTVDICATACGTWVKFDKHHESLIAGAVSTSVMAMAMSSVLFVHVVGVYAILHYYMLLAEDKGISFS